MAPLVRPVAVAEQLQPQGDTPPPPSHHLREGALLAFDNYRGPPSLLGGCQASLFGGAWCAEAQNQPCTSSASRPTPIPYHRWPQ